MDVEFLVKVVDVITRSIKIVLEIFPADSRRKILEKLRTREKNDGIIKLNNALVILECVGMLIIGFAYAFLMIIYHPNLTGIISGFGMFAAFAMFALFFFKLGYRKFVSSPWPQFNRS